MPNYSVIKSRAAMAACFTILSAVTGLASCGGGASSEYPSPSSSSPAAAAPLTHVIASITPKLVALGSARTAEITWSSTDSTTCSSSPAGITTTEGSFTTPALTATTSYVITCTGPTGEASTKATIAFAPAYTVTPIINAAAACAAYPQNSAGTIYYFCDCQTGAQPGCASGNDRDNDGLSPSSPKQTIGSAALHMRTLLSPNDTVALCKGGVFNATGSLSIGSNRCTAGTTCNDFRDYTPPSGATAKPIINNAPGNMIMFPFMGNVGGVRILNLKLQGASVTDGDNNGAFFFYNGAHDVTMCNVEMDGFDITIHQTAGNSTDPNIKLTGSHIANSRTMGYLGSGPNLEISYNHWDGNGGTNVFDHTIYLSGSAVPHVSFIGNYIHGQFGPTCYGVVLTAHGSFDYLTVANNAIDIDASASTGGCYGMAFGSGGYRSPSYYRHSVFSGNTFSNVGNAGMYISTCPDCLIENNLVKIDKRVGTVAIYAGAEAARPLYNDDVNDRNLIRNNTIWYGPNATGGGIGVKVANEGTGHRVVNNTITYTSTEPGIWGGVRCYDYPLPLASYSHINNNHCFSNAAYSWVAGHGTLAAWQADTSALPIPFDTLSKTDPPLFVDAGNNFAHDAGSPLRDAGTTLHTSPYSGIDLTGGARDAAPDIGAFEYRP